MFELTFVKRKYCRRTTNSNNVREEPVFKVYNEKKKLTYEEEQKDKSSHDSDTCSNSKSARGLHS